MLYMFSPTSYELGDPETVFSNFDRAIGRAAGTDVAQSASAAGLAGRAGAVRHAAEAGGRPEPCLAGRRTTHPGMCRLSNDPRHVLRQMGVTWVVYVSPKQRSILVSEEHVLAAVLLQHQRCPHDIRC